MCKIFAITDLSKTEVTPKLLDAIKSHVCKSDNHGFGYAVVGTSGAIGGERTVRVPQFKALSRGQNSGVAEKLPIVKKTSNQFGELREALRSPKSLVAHGRFSTNTVSLDNTHPYFNGELALIHNGVVSDAAGKVRDRLETDNDTEILLRYWEDGGVEAIESSVTGYYAMAVLESSGLLNIVRDDRAQLHLAWVRSINSYIIATTQEIISGVCKAMKWKSDPIEAINDNCHAIFDGNEILEHRDIFPRRAPVTSQFESQASMAFGGKKYTGRYLADDTPSYRENYLKEVRALEDEEDAKDLYEEFTL